MKLIHNALTQRSPHFRAELAKPTPHRPIQKISLPPSFSAEYVINPYFSRAVRGNRAKK